MVNKKAKPEVHDDDLLGEDEPTAGVGHNNPPKEKKEKVGHQGFAADQLRSIVERIERLTEEKQAIQGDISDVFGEAKANGYCTKTIRSIIKLRKLDNHERDEQEYTLDLYRRALGLVADYDV